MLAPSEEGPRAIGWAAGSTLEGAELVARMIPEASPEELVPLVDFLAAWRPLPNVSRWVLRTIRCGYTSSSSGHLYSQLPRRLANPGEAQSRQLAVRHRDVVLDHMKVLGLRLNAKKIVLSPLQNTAFSGWSGIRSRCERGFLPPASVNPLTREADKARPVTHCKAVPETVRARGSGVQRDYIWPDVHETPLVMAHNQRVFPERQPISHDQGTWRCLRALDMWKNLWFLSQGPVLGAPFRRRVLTTDASLTGWGAILEGRSAQLSGNDGGLFGR